MGDGTSSERRGGGSFLDSVFQIPVPHGNELLLAEFHVIEPPIPGLVFAIQLDGSPAGLAGFEPPEDKGPPVFKDVFLGKANGTSLSQDVLRVGLGGGAVEEGCTSCD